MITTIPIMHTIPIVPFYSQFTDIHTAPWQKVGCGITSLAMIINYYNGEKVTVDTLLKEGVAMGAYNKNAGWVHKDLIAISNNYGLSGKSYDLSGSKNEVAFETLKKLLADGPVMASIHYQFNPKSSIPHVVVIDGIENGLIYYNDPAAKIGQKKISVEDFQKGWKRKLIVLRPTENKKTSVA